MNRYVMLNRAYAHNRPYEVGVDLEDDARPILLAEGSGHSDFGGTFPLQELLEPQWTQQLEVCACLWLRDLAIEEQQRGQRFTAAEILARTPPDRKRK